MGILNVTPDSFSDGGRWDDPERARRRTVELLEQGADLIDLGAESTRPGAEAVAVDEEIRRLEPALAAALEAGAIVSVDTRKLEVARWALEHGAHLINDVGGLPDPMLDLLAEFEAPGIAMHMKGDPKTMQVDPRYANVVEEVAAFLGERVAAGRERGVEVVVDPGVGFGKKLDHNLDLLAGVGRLRERGALVLAGTSRKSFLAKLTDRPVEERLAGSLASGMVAAALGADILRVHDVREHVDARTVWNAIAERAPQADASVHWQVFSERVTLDCHIGVGDEERGAVQPVLCDVRLRRTAVPADPPGRGDEVSRTVDYAAVVQVLRAEASRVPRRLLETLADDLAAVLGASFPQWQVDLELRKPVIADQLAVGAVGIGRRASGGGDG